MRCDNVIRSLFAMILGFIALSIVGCGDGKTSVSGKASFQGEPIAKGEIAFVPNEKNNPADAGVIENGSFTLRVSPGKKIVQIRGSKPLPREQQPPEGGLLYEDFIPARHHTESTLEVEIPTGGKNDFMFDLKN